MDAGSSIIPNVSSVEELIDWFLSQYEEQVKLCHDVSCVHTSMWIKFCSMCHKGY